MIWFVFYIGRYIEGRVGGGGGIDVEIRIIDAGCERRSRGDRSEACGDANRFDTYWQTHSCERHDHTRRRDTNSCSTAQTTIDRR